MSDDIMSNYHDNLDIHNNSSNNINTDDFIDNDNTQNNDIDNNLTNNISIKSKEEFNNLQDNEDIKDNNNSPNITNGNINEDSEENKSFNNINDNISNDSSDSKETNIINEENQEDINIDETLENSTDNINNGESNEDINPSNNTHENNDNNEENNSSINTDNNIDSNDSNDSSDSKEEINIINEENQEEINIDKTLENSTDINNASNEDIYPLSNKDNDKNEENNNVEEDNSSINIDNNIDSKNKNNTNNNDENTFNKKETDISNSEKSWEQNNTKNDINNNIEISNNQKIELKEEKLEKILETPKEMILPSPVHDEYTAEQIEEMINNFTKTSDIQTKITIINELFDISPTAIGKEVLSSKMEILVNSLKEDNINLQEIILQIINIVGTSDKCKIEFRKVGGFKILVNLFSSEFKIQSLALNTIGYFITREINNARELMNVGGIPPLIEFLSHNNYRIQFFAAACVWVLAAYQEEFQDILLQVGAVEKLFNIIDSEQEDISWQAAGALRNLVLKNPRIPQFIIKANGIEKYKTVLNRNECTRRVIGLIIQTFVIISSSDIIKDEVHSVGIFVELLSLLSNPKTKIELKSRILYTITNLCTKHPLNQNQFYNDNGVDIIMNILKNETLSEGLRADAATTLWASSVNNEKIVKYLCIEKNFKFIQQALVMEPEKVLVGIVATITNIASILTDKSFLIERGIIPLILDFLRGSYVPLLETTAGAIVALIRNNEGNISQIMTWDGPLLLASNITCENIGVKQNILAALRILLGNQFVKTLKAIRDTSSIQPMLNILGDTNEPKLQLTSACCLCLLAENSELARKDIIKYQAQNSIIIGLNDSSPNLKSIICDLIQYLAVNNSKFRSILGQNNILVTLIELVKSNNIDPILLEKGIKAIWSLCISNPLHQQITKDKGCINHLLNLLLEEEGRIRTKSAILKALAAICNKIQEFIRTYPKAIDKIVECLTVGEGVTELGEQAALLIWCLSLDNTKMRNTLRTSNALIPLIELLANNQTNNTVIVNVLGSIITLSKKSNKNRQIIKDAGIINIVKGLNIKDNTYINTQIEEILTIFG